MATLVANNAEAPVSRLALQPGINTLGRAEGNHHVVPHSSVSSRHCEIIVNDGSVLVRDLGSTNGTFVDGKQITQAALVNGQRLKLGNVEFLLEAPELASVSSGPLRVNVLRNVSTVETADAPLMAHTASEAIAKLANAAPVLYDGPTFYQHLPRAFSYPFSRNGMFLFVVGTVAWVVASFFWRFALLLQVTIRVCTIGYLFAYLQSIVSHSAEGDDEVPDFPDVTEFWSDIVIPFFLFFFTVAISFGPAIACTMLAEDHPIAAMLLLPATLFGSVYFPMALLTVGVSDNVLGISPHIVLPAIVRIFVPYFIAWMMVVLLGAIAVATIIGMTFVPIPILPTFVIALVCLYVLAVQMRILGLLFRVYRDRLGWL